MAYPEYPPQLMWPDGLPNITYTDGGSLGDGVAEAGTKPAGAIALAVITATTSATGHRRSPGRPISTLPS